jgi:LysR family cys regulon transcriptional activator
VKLQQLRYLVAVVDNGLNVTAAAESLHTTQPAISKQIRLLEEELGLSVFHRRGRSLAALTAEGELIVERARRVLCEVANMRSLADDLVGEQQGLLSIATTHTQARYVLPETIRRFRARYPRVALELHQGTAEQIAELVAADAVDFAIVTGSRQLFSGLTILPCYQWDRMILVPPDHPLARNAAPSLATLARYPLLTYVFSRVGESSFKRAFAEQGLEPNIVFTARDADIIKAYVRVGLGVGVIASMACDEDDLVAIDAAGLFPRCTTWLGFPRGRLLRRYMFDFAHLFAPHLTPALMAEVASAPDQAAVNALVGDIELPLKGRAGHEPRRIPA